MKILNLTFMVSDVVPTKSCEDVLKEKGLYEEVKSVLTTKSTRK